MNVNNLLSNPERACDARLGVNHGYAFEGDTVRLNATLDVLDPARVADGRWLLQLWASAAPFDGGKLVGTKVAEIALENLSQAETSAQIEDSAFARIPAGCEERYMTLALAHGGDNGCATIHDYATYPLPQRFALPRFVGRDSLRLGDGVVDVAVEVVDNPRAADNLSGTLSLQVWALREAYNGGDFEGIALAGVEIGQLAGGVQRSDIHFSADVQALPQGTWHLVLMLREWTGVGYMTRDLRNFPEPHAVTAETPPAKASKQTAGVSVNRASEADLAALKGMPKPVAKAIVAGRPYAALDDLLRVKGMGSKLLEKLRGQLQL